MTEVRLLSYDGWKTVPQEIIQTVDRYILYQEQRCIIILKEGTILKGVAQIYENNELVFAGFLTQSSAS